ncbi:DUF4184 family protein [Streptomyces sp. NPDC059740]|uniref:DUF4184 family protein n=1 Tax=Streptomyces sp. NPDC059740 TaxID=3346926 RepID=UPI00364FF7B0
MPFTLSHAAAVLPALRADGTARSGLCASALVAGSFAPDVPYFAASLDAHAMALGRITHSPAAAATVDVAVAAALVGCWLLVRDPLVALLPATAQGRVHAALTGRGAPAAQPAALRTLTGRPADSATAAPPRPPRTGATEHRRIRRPGAPGRAVRFAVSAAVGAGTHLLWDAFTHQGRAGVRAFPALNTPVAGMPWYSALQYGTSALALLVLARYGTHVLRRVGTRPTPPSLAALTPRARRTGVLLLAAGIGLGAAHRCAGLYAASAGTARPEEYLPAVCFGAGAGLTAAALAHAAVTARTAGRGRRPGHREATPAPPRDRTSTG